MKREGLPQCVREFCLFASLLVEFILYLKFCNTNFKRRPKLTYEVLHGITMLEIMLD